jgi:2-deoxy-D-gluconate 3-dehydrogenase
MDQTTLRSLFSLEGKTALVTGCTRGIGKAIAAAMAAAGADIIGASATLTADGGAVGDEVRALGRKFTGYTCDFSNRSAVHDLAARLQANHPAIDILVNNAGTIRRAPAAQHSDEDWDAILETNLSSAFVLTREIGRSMVERRSGKVIFLASLLTFQGGITVPGYAASKGAIGQLTKAFANEWAESGVNVNAIAPGYIETDNTQALRDNPERSRQILERIPAGRWGKPEDIAGAAVFLASAAANYIHGTLGLVSSSG